MVESTMVMVLLLVLFVSVLQVGFALHVRNVLATAAAEGARHGTVADGSLRAAESRAQEVARGALASSVVEDVVAQREVVDGVELVRVRLTGRLPMLGPWVPGARTSVEGVALQEGG